MSFSLGVIVAHHDTQVPGLPVAAVRQLVDGGGESLREYWREMTFGNVDLLPTYYTCEVTLDHRDLGAAGRTESIRKAYETVRATVGEAAAAHDGYLVLCHPGPFVVANPQAGEPGQTAMLAGEVNGGTASAPNGARAVLSGTRGSHTFLAHELGHVLGFRHSFGLLNDGIHYGAPTLDAAGNQISDPFPRAVSHEYGDPVDIMSAESFGHRWLDSVNTVWVQASPSFAGSTIDGWPGSAPTSALGPGLSPAVLHQVHPEWLPDGSVSTYASVPCEGRLEPARGAHQGPRLAVLTTKETTEGRGRLYLEWRPAVGWDQGLATTEDGQEDRAGLVVHELADTPNLGVRPWYRGVVPVPEGADTDLDVFGTPYRVTVLGSGPGVVRFRVSQQDGRSVRLDVHLHSEIVDGRDVLTKRTPCGHTVQWGRWILRPSATVRAVVAGLGGTGQPTDVPVSLNWWISSVAVGDTDGTLGVAHFGGTALTYAFTSTPGGRDLLLRGETGETYELPLRIRATDGEGNVEATTAIALRGEFVGFHPDGRGAIEACFERVAYERLRLRPRDLLVPPDPGLGPRRRWQLERDARLRRLADEHPIETEFLRDVIRSRTP